MIHYIYIFKTTLYTFINQRVGIERRCLALSATHFFFYENRGEFLWYAPEYPVSGHRRRDSYYDAFRVTDQVQHPCSPYLILLARGHVDVVGVVRPKVMIINVLVPVLLLVTVNLS
jgi:hypothetical protein